MSNDLAVPPHPEEGDLPEAWREHDRRVRRAREAKGAALSEEEIEDLIARIGEEGDD